MILFTILLICLAVLIVSTAVVLGLGGTVFIILFADIIVCFAIIGYLIHCFINRKK